MELELNAWAAGDPAGDYTQFFQRSSPYLVRLGYLLLGERTAAEDVAQDVLEEMYRRWSTLRPDSLSAYAHTSVVNQARSVGRRKTVARKFSFLLATPTVAATEPEEDPALWQLVQTLPRRQREVVVLRYWCDLTEADIAQVLGVSPGTVKSSASRALARLAGSLGDGSPVPGQDVATGKEDV
ncbi:MAG TPA: SigE family RNA polymerase sigma factor [Kineosporiaceae bacterium]|nr:SigE family RNA polymerase sigma factor [Kineosporiaceae bacterium]